MVIFNVESEECKHEGAFDKRKPFFCAYIPAHEFVALVGTFLHGSSDEGGKKLPNI